MREGAGRKKKVEVKVWPRQSVQIIEFGEQSEDILLDLGRHDLHLA